MIPARTTNRQEALDPLISRRLSELRQVAVTLKKSRLSPLEICRTIIDGRALDLKTRAFFAGLPENEKHYWISSLYALLMPAARRRKLAAYFTPPHLAQYAIDLLTAAGIQPGKDRILDPASGGAAFLVPLAARIAGRARQRGASAESILRAIESTLAGVEIEPDLAKLSKALLADLLGKEIRSAGRRPSVSIKQADTLRLPAPDVLYDAVIGNPPYGRVFRPTKAILKAFAPVITDGYVNLYVLFLEQALRLVKPGGVICLIIPMSFLGGPYFSSLRKRILETSHVLSLDPIDKRSDVFLDVLYDVCVLVLRKKGISARTPVPTSSLLMIGQPNRLLGNLDLPEQPTGRMWALPDEKQKDSLFQTGLETLRDYGYVAKTGYFVWNREQHRYRVGKKPRPTEVPLFWAHNIKPGVRCKPYDSESGADRIGFVKINTDSTAVIHSDAIILQRTSNKRQSRRLIAAVVRQSTVPGERGFVGENHTIIIVPDPAKKQKIPIAMLCRLLNTAAVDARFRRISGSVSVSTKALNQLPLPTSAQIRAAFRSDAEDERAVEVAYAASLKSVPRKSSAAAANR
ncbi:MAG: N-6 DNA methylase [Candidatus Acidiferrales bacterium]|jgi:adenine-specific DNA-methyltransferase